MKRFVALTLLVPSLSYAQDDRAAGLFAKARQLPMVGQSIAIEARPTSAEVTLHQTFYNDGRDVAQADYRVHTPADAAFLGFGFWQKERFFAAKLAAKEEAKAAHAKAADEGRTTGLAQSEGQIHGFSVYPVAAFSTQKIEARFSMPVVREMGRSHLRVPIDQLVGQKSPSTTIVVRLKTDHPIEKVGVTGASYTVLKQGPKAARIILSTQNAVDVWWREAGPPLSVRAQAVRIADHETFAVEMRVALNDADAGHPKSVAVFVDGSSSMRRKADAAAELVRRMGVHTKVDAYLFAEQVRTADARGLKALIQSGAVGHVASWSALETKRETICRKRECILVSDPSFEGLKTAAQAEMSVVLLADAHEMSFFEEQIPNGAHDYRIDVPSPAALRAVADSLVLPALSIVELTKETPLLVLTTAKRQVVEGSVLRLLASTQQLGPVVMKGQIKDVSVEKTFSIEQLAVKSKTGRRIRRAYFQNYLAKEMEKYRASPTAERRAAIIALSVREDVPTDLTALQVSAPRPAGARVATRRGSGGFYGSSAPEPAEWAVLLLMFGLVAWASRRKRVTHQQR